MNTKDPAPRPAQLVPGAKFPDIDLPAIDGTRINLGQPGWRAVFVIRGAHCQICRTYLGALEAKRKAWETRGIEVVVVSADPLEQSRELANAVGYRGRFGHSLDVPAMRTLGLWMTGPETSKLRYVHSEPGFFVVDPDGNVAAAEASTMPSVRPDLEWLDRSFAYIVDNDVRPPFGRYGRCLSAALQRRGETVLLTGATGYIGSVVAERLLASGYAVRGLTRSDSKAADLRARGIEPWVGDVKNTDLMTAAATGVSAIVHTAAPNAPTPGQTMEQMLQDAARAIDGLAATARTHGIRLLVTSGASLYGPSEGKILDETAPLRAPPFAASLVAAETALLSGAHGYIIRPGVVYGRGQSDPMRAMLEQINEPGAPGVVDPTNRLPIVHVEDLADLYVAILEENSPPRVVNGVASIVPWPEIVTAAVQAAQEPGDLKALTVEEAMTLGGPAVYMAIDMAVSGELAVRRLRWQPRQRDLRASLAATAQ